MHPGPGYWVFVLTGDGEQIVADLGTTGRVNDLVSAHIAPSGHFYYSCRNESEAFPNGPNSPADTGLIGFATFFSSELTA